MFKSILSPLTSAAKSSAATAVSSHCMYGNGFSGLHSNIVHPSSSSFATIYKRTYHNSTANAFGFAEFFDKDKMNPDGTPVIHGRSWTPADLRRKSFDDIHKLWFVLYKERNMLLSEKEYKRSSMKPQSASEERRYFKIKRSMAAIKRVLSERHKIIRTQRQHEVTSAVGEPSVNISSDDNYNNEQVSKTT